MTTPPTPISSEQPTTWERKLQLGATVVVLIAMVIAGIFYFYPNETILTSDPCSLLNNPSAQDRLKVAGSCYDDENYQQAATILLEGESTFFSVPESITDKALELQRAQFISMADLANKLLDKIKPIKPKSKDLANAQVNLGILYGRYMMFSQETAKTIKVYEKAGADEADDIKEAILYYWLGRAYERFDTKDACVKYQSSLDKFENIDEPDIKLQVYSSIILNQIWMDKCPRNEIEPITTITRTKYMLPEWEFEYYYSISEFFFGKTQLQNLKAMQPYSRELEIFAPDKEKIQANCLCLNNEDCQWENCNSVLIESAEFRRKQADSLPFTKDNVDFLIANKCSLDDPDEKKLGLELADKLGLEYLEAFCDRNLGWLSEDEEGDISKAREYYLKAHNSFRFFDDKKWIGNTAVDLTYTYYITHDSVLTDHNELRQYFDLAKDMALETEYSMLLKDVAERGIEIATMYAEMYPEEICKNEQVQYYLDSIKKPKEKFENDYKGTLTDESNEYYKYYDNQCK
jgi:tetratricopeptide (TPR) repeat protein